jgi:hypothetical protein
MPQKLIDLTGKTFGYWNVLNKEGKAENGAILWMCECKCGTKKILRGGNLKRCVPYSCGCHKNKNLIGEKFNMLTIINKGCDDKHWICQCECGNIKEIPERYLIYNLIKSCGCIKKEKNEYIINEDYIIVKDNNLNEFIIDKESLDKIKNYYWFVNNDYVYNTKKERLHRFLFNLTKEDKMVVDHINHNTKDNRMCNLRIATRSQNAMNMVIPKHNTSGFKGVYWNKNENKWVASIKINGKNIHLGYFENIEDAILTRQNAEDVYFGEFKYIL